jgi:hypothetical protein
MRNLLVALALLCAGSFVMAAEVPLTIHRSTPEPVEGMAADEHRTIVVRQTGCEGRFAVRSAEYRFAITPRGQNLLVDISGLVTFEKLAKGPAAAPVIAIEMNAGKGTSTLAFAAEYSMLSASWETGGTFQEELRSGDMFDAKFWTAIEIRCSTQSPFTSTAVPDHVVYKTGDPQKIIATATQLRAALESEHGFAAVAFGESFLIGPTLYAAIKGDATLAAVESPTVMMIDPETHKTRALLRIKGEKEVALFAAAMRRYLGDAKPRIRAATSSELGVYWTAISWDIEEPLLVADYGAHALLFDYTGGDVMMVEEARVAITAAAAASPPLHAIARARPRRDADIHRATHSRAQ